MSTTDAVITLKRRVSRCERQAEVLPQIPRITKVMALAINFQDMVDSGEVRDYAEVASTSTSSLAGNQTFISRKIDARSDIFSFGSMLYEM